MNCGAPVSHPSIVKSGDELCSMNPAPHSILHSSILIRPKSGGLFGLKCDYPLRSLWWGGSDPPHPEKNEYSLMVNLERSIKKNRKTKTIKTKCLKLLIKTGEKVLPKITRDEF